MTERAGAVAAKVDELALLLRAGEVVVLTGAGVSTDSGIPAYRDEDGRWMQSPPMQYREFTGSVLARQRYWARSLVGWERMARAQPNAAHHALTEMERRGWVRLLITQNVDGLHSMAGSQRAVDLHGRLDRVVCLGCGLLSSRADLQARLTAHNPAFASRPGVVRADGDVELDAADYGRFEVLGCEGCGGILKPDVVFFGEHVPAPRVHEAMDVLTGARSLLIVGSSLMVFSGFRFARAATRLGVPIALVNRGSSRADALAAVKLTGGAAEILQRTLAWG